MWSTLVVGARVGRFVDVAPIRARAAAPIAAPARIRIKCCVRGVRRATVRRPTGGLLFYSIVAIFIGAGLGALLRWFLSIGLNAILPEVPLGTLAANLIGGYLIGFAIAVFGAKSGLPPEWRLFAITGFLGGLTTFSTFSAEVMTHALQGEFGWAFAVAALHLMGSFTLTALGMWTARMWLVAA
jgi:CrcB protein